MKLRHLLLVGVLPAAHVFKVRGKGMSEALGFMRPYMSKGGWSDFPR